MKTLAGLLLVLALAVPAFGRDSYHDALEAMQRAHAATMEIIERCGAMRHKTFSWAVLCCATSAQNSEPTFEAHILKSGHVLIVGSAENRAFFIVCVNEYGYALE